jgi:hypothetical protein
MRTGRLGLIGLGLLSFAPVFAQSPVSAPTAPGKSLPTVVATPAPAQVAAAAPRATLGFDDGNEAGTESRKEPKIEPPCEPAKSCCVEFREYPNCMRTWVRTDYLMWWTKPAQIPAPLVTTGVPAVGFPLVNTAGAIGQPGTTVLHGGSDESFGMFSGLRFTLCSWTNNDLLTGWEASGFLLERRVNSFAAASDATGNPPLYFPAFNVTAQQERALPIADPLRGFAGDVRVDSTLEFWGVEFNGLLALWRERTWEVVLLGGFRYVDLKENLFIQNASIDTVLLNSELVHDHFDTRNQFYAGQVGTRASWKNERWSADLTAKLAMGSTHQVVNISGDITQTALPGGVAPTPGTFAHGIYAQSTNSGRRSSNQFGVMPAVEARVGFQLTARVRASVGYDFLYWNQVVRPGNQLDRNINQTQSPVFAGGVLVGPPLPAPLFQRTDFWVHGLNLGLEVRY